MNEHNPLEETLLLLPSIMLLLDTVCSALYSTACLNAELTPLICHQCNTASRALPFQPGAFGNLLALAFAHVHLTRCTFELNQIALVLFSAWQRPSRLAESSTLEIKFIGD